MGARKLLISSIFLSFVSGSAFAMDYRNESSTLLYNVQWDTESIRAQQQGAVYLRAQIEKLEQENEQLRNSVSRLKNAPVAQNDKTYDTRIQALIEENKRLTDLANKKSVSSASSADHYAQKLYILQAQNKELQQRLSVLEQSANVKSIAEQGHKTQLSALQQENQTLRTQLKNAKNVKPTVNKNDFNTLKSQNASLRETIRAQNEVLKSTDNAARTAERMVDENNFLKKQMEQLKRVHEDNSKTSQDLFQLNDVLRQEVANRDAYIAKLEGLKDVVSDLKQDNAAYASGTSLSGKTKQQIDGLGQRNVLLEQELKKERGNAIAYRAKIREYQDQVLALQESTNTTIDNKISQYQKSEEQLTVNIQKKESTISELQVQNQELQARLDLTAGQVSDNERSSQQRMNELNDTLKNMEEDLLLQKHSVIALQEENISLQAQLEKERSRKENMYVANASLNKVGHSPSKDKAVSAIVATKDNSVSYVETAYPPVEQVLPLLDKEGTLISYEGQTPQQDEVLILPEDLLAVEVKPLSSR
ncbi:MAG: hypothetical protein ACRBDL_03930 [Alphaproteobacteria bacterium]